VYDFAARPVSVAPRIGAPCASGARRPGRVGSSGARPAHGGGSMTVSTPTRWQGQGLVTPPKQMLRFKRLFGVTLSLDDPAIGRIRDGLTASDPVADEVVAWAASEPPGSARLLFERVLIEGAD